MKLGTKLTALVKREASLVLLRHGQSTWNLENRFTGWTDVPLTYKGILEAKCAGRLLKSMQFRPTIIYTSLLTRAIKTANLVTEEMKMEYLPVERSWRLNERHYGALQGLNKSETAKLHGEEQVKLWRRSYDIPPPALDGNDARHPANDPRYHEIPVKSLPTSESLLNTLIRVLPFFEDKVFPKLLKGENVMVVAHGNSIRAVVKELDGLSKSEILDVNIPTGIPLVYEFDGNLKVVKKEYLGSKEEVNKRSDEVRDQLKTNTPKI